MTSNQTGQLEQSELALNIHSAGWRQGSVFLPDEVIALPFLFDPINEVLIIISQSCSVVSSRFDNDPLVDAIVARRLSEYNEKAPEATGKNQRKLHIKLAVEKKGCGAYECDINRRVSFERIKLLDLSIIHDLSIEICGAKKIATWIGRYYTRIALPDELVTRMKQYLLPALSKILKKDNIHAEVDRIYISWHTSQSVQDFFNLRFIFICKSQDVADKLDQACLQELNDFLEQPGKDKICIAHLHCGTKSDIFLADLDGYDRFSEWDYLTHFGELHKFIDGA